MSFQFVNVTPGQTEHDDETRRKIRSQAMRDFRRRQRFEESTPESTEGSPSEASSPPQSSAGGSRQESRKRKGSTQSLPTDLEVHRRTSSSLSRDELPTIHDEEGVKQRRPSPKTSISDEQAKLSRNIRQRASTRAQPGVFGTFTVNLPRRQRPRRPTFDDINPLDTPGQLEHLLSICQRYNHWLGAQWPSQPELDLPGDPSNDTTSQMLLFALCLKSIGYLDALEPGQTRADTDLLKTKVLALINRRLKSPTEALEDRTIGALACLTSYEISRGSREATMHLHGLCQIIRLRGGTVRIGDNGGLAMFLQMLDLVHAVFFSEAPLYTAGDTSQPSSLQDTPQLQPDQDMLDEISDLIMSIPERVGPDDPPEDLALQPSITPSTLEMEVQGWYQFLKQPEPTVAVKYDGALAYACKLAAGLHLAAYSPLAANSARLQLQAVELFSVMSRLPDDAWEACHTLHLRILLTAFATAPSSASKSWYVAHLTRCLYQTEQHNWSLVKDLMLRFIAMQSMARQPRRQSVRALANDVEVVVDPAEADEMDLSVQSAAIDPSLGSMRSGLDPRR
ncbi:uncharacterized protein LTR77_001232 [Saxophila tyrrhenica]|uniref:Tachykinin family protein n=1 Tax=Saxophila tyrrhenica TaxID=1690608 RepID=A0AAV9PLI2_9PEZI|nr:hypothetical protein LTR77_001232 [Saxophila tyrrhenica]